MKKLIAMATALCLCTTGFYLPNNSESVFSSISAIAETSATDFTFDAETGTIYKYNGEGGDVVIPSEIDGVDVTCIGDKAFYKCKSLTSITIPDSVSIIGDSVFEWCTNLESITIPDSVSNIGDSVFERCTNLESITIPNSVSNIGVTAFSYCQSLTSITIPESVTSIGNYAFYNCISLASITIPDSVTSIGDKAFYGTAWLDSKRKENPLVIVNNNLIDGKNCKGDVVIPDSVTSIGYEAFWVCVSLKSITIPDSVTSIGGGAFSETPWLNSKREENPFVIVNNILIDGINCEGDVVIPDSVTSIGGNAFKECTNLTSVTIPDSVTSIGNLAIYNCTSLTSITIPDSVTSIGASAFAWCTNLENITIPGSVTSIDAYAFEGCSSLTSITILDSVTSIGDAAFSNCSNLESIKGYIGSEAERYANANRIPFIALDGAATTATTTSTTTTTTTTSKPTTTNTTTTNTKLGDADGNGITNAVDASMILKYYYEISAGMTPSKADMDNADFNGDGKIDAVDAIEMLREYVLNSDPNTEYKLKEGFDPSAAKVCPIITASKIVYDNAAEIAGEIVTVSISITDYALDNAYCSTGFHIAVDPRLTIIPDKRNNYAKPGDALEALSSYTSLIDDNIIATAAIGKEDEGFTGVLYEFNVRIPEDAKKGDIYFIDVYAAETDIFRKSDADTADSKNMEAYLFTKGIYSKNNPSNDMYLIKSNHTEADGYIAIEDPTVTTTTSTTTSKPTTTSTATSSNITMNDKKGDANCDGEVNMADAVLIMQSMANPNKYGIKGTDKTHISEQGMKNADVTTEKDGVTNADALVIQKFILKLIDKL